MKFVKLHWKHLKLHIFILVKIILNLIMEMVVTVLNARLCIVRVKFLLQEKFTNTECMEIQDTIIAHQVPH